MTLQEQLEKLMSETGIQQSDVAKGIGQSDALVSQWHKGVYKGNNAKVDEAIANFIHREQKKREIKDLEIVFCRTETAKRVWAFLEMVHQSRGQGLFVGCAGMGKTTIQREYARHHPDVILLEVSPTYTPAVILKTIAKKIGASHSGSLNDIYEAILAKLTGSGRMILADEAENLSTRSLEILRRLRDQAKIGLLLAGTMRLKTNLIGRHGELEQLFSRVGCTFILPEHTADDELAQILRITLPSLSIELNQKIVKSANGSLRRLENLMYYLDRASKQSETAINEEMLQVIEKWLLAHGA